jgi:hypothetical protein
MAPIFDPILIGCQIVSLQCFYYIGMGTVLGLFHAIFGSTISLDHFFTPRYVHLTTVIGLSELFCFILTALIGSWLLSIVVERSKKCVDFTFTVYFIHIILCTIYLEFPLGTLCHDVLYIYFVLIVSYIFYTLQRGSGGSCSAYHLSWWLPWASTSVPEEN